MKKLILAIAFLILTGFSFSLYKWITDDSEGPVTFLDYPRDLSDKTDTIEVTYIAWACACANWLPANYMNDPGYYESDSSKDCIFIEAERPGIKIPHEYQKGGNSNRIRLIGRYYSDKGISRDYEKPTSQKPEWAKVFRYSEVEIIKPYTIWDFSTEGADLKVIKKGMKSIFEE